MPRIQDDIKQIKTQTRAAENEVHFYLSGVENIEEIKSSYNAKVNSLKQDI